MTQAHADSTIAKNENPKEVRVGELKMLCVSLENCYGRG